MSIELQAYSEAALGYRGEPSDTPLLFSQACGMKGMANANANEYSAMVDFAYNAGCGGLTSTWSGSVVSRIPAKRHGADAPEDAFPVRFTSLLTLIFTPSQAKGNWKGIAEVLPRTYTK